MKLPQPRVEDDSANAPPRKTLWNAIHTSTPVILTVLATALAGLSTSEMTLAQYHRALAAQNQSKAGDQWSLFQAKRIRGSNLQTTLDLLAALPDAVTADGLRDASAQLLHDLERGQAEAKQLLAALEAPQTRTTNEAALRQAIEEFQRSTAARSDQARLLERQVRKSLERSDAERVLAGVASGNLLPQVPEAGLDPDVQQAVQDVQARRTDAEMQPLIARLAERTLEEAKQAAEAGVAAVEKAAKPTSDVFDELQRLIARQVLVARSFDRSARRLEHALADRASSAGKLPQAATTATETITRLGTSARTSLEEVSGDFKAARNSYMMARYDREARSCERAATVYEVVVRKNSLGSERHRARSKHFFYGMLAAQAGVTIASFSLAVRHKSVLWSLATLAGLGALLFGAYVYLYV